MNLAPLLLSFEVAIAATIITGVVGIALGWLLATRRFMGRDLIDAIVATPLILPPTVLGYYVLVAVGRRSIIGHAWEHLFGSPLVFSVAGVVLAACLGALPLVTRSARAALEGVDPALVGVARTLGAGPLRAFLTVHLRLAAPGVAAGMMLGFARALGDFGVTLMISGDLPGQTQTASLAIYDAVASGHDSEAAGLAAVLAAVGIVVVYASTKLARRVGARS